MRAGCLDHVLRLGYTVIGACGVLCLIAAVATNDWIQIQEPFPIPDEQTMTTGDLGDNNTEGFPGEGYPGGGYPGGAYPGGAYPGESYPGENLPEGYPEEGYPVGEHGADGYGATAPPFEAVDDAFVIFARSGLWQVCFRLQTQNGMGLDRFTCTPIDYFSQAWNGRPQEGGRDTIFSIARGSRKSTFPLLLSLLLSVLAVFIGTTGNWRGRQNSLTMVGAILYLLSSLLVMLSAMLFMLAVNDEVGHRPKPRNTDSHLLFRYNYSWGVAFLICGYVCCSVAAVTNVYLYQRGFHHRVQELLDDGGPGGGLPSILTLLRGHKGRIPGLQKNRDHELLYATPIVVE